MKKVLVALAAVAIASTASAKIEGGSHDLSGATGPRYNGTLSTCQYCHAPHNANIGIAGTPLWNRKGDATFAASFTKYTSATLNGTPNLGANSLTCLSCHDGATDMGDTFTGSKGFAAPTTMPTSFRTVDPAFPGASPVVGKDLGNDHPVGVVYPTVPNSGYKADPTGVKLYAVTGSAARTVECGSCHDPHGESDGRTGSGASGFASFLRVNASSICSSCHDK